MSFERKRKNWPGALERKPLFHEDIYQKEFGNAELG